MGESAENTNSGLNRRELLTGAATLGAAVVAEGVSVALAAEATPDTLKKMGNIEVAKGQNVIADPKEDDAIKRWCVERLSNDGRFQDGVMRLIKGHADVQVRYSSPSNLPKTIENVRVRIMLPPGAKRWTWSQGGRGVEGYEAIFVDVTFKDRGVQVYYFHRNFEKIDPNRTKWE